MLQHETKYFKLTQDFSNFQSGKVFSFLDGTEFTTYAQLQAYISGSFIRSTSIMERLIRVKTHNGSSDQTADSDLVSESDKVDN